jgi:HD superfamily phosphodiesterase
MDLSGIIESAEKQYKQILEDFFISVYNEKYLSSHGIDHHRRVWSYSKELLKQSPLLKTVHLSKLASGLIIASYLHDIGMSVDQGPKHGEQSKNLCVRFLNNNNIPHKEYEDVLEAIENHDNKDYTYNPSNSELLRLLSVADDLDAFGFTGIFRYSEIYLARGVDPEKIGTRIRENAEKRFSNFVRNFGSDNELSKKHTERYRIIDDFFIKYNEQLPSYQFGTLNPSGFCGVIEFILILLNNKLQLKDIFPEPEKYSNDLVIKWFFSEFASELLVEHTLL